MRGPGAPEPGKRTLTEDLVPAGRAAPRSGGTDKASDATAAQDPDGAVGALLAAADIMSNRRSREIGALHSRYVSTLWKLYAAVTGVDGSRHLSATQRNTMFQEVRQELAPAIDAYAKSADGRDWLDDYFYPEFNTTVSSLAFSEARERVHNAVLGDSGHVVEIPGDGEPRKQGEVLHGEIAKLIPVIKAFNEQLIRMNEHEIMHEATALLEHGKGHGAKAGSLAELTNVLMLVDAWLTLSDEELREHLAEIHGVFHGVSTYAELVKAITELTGGAIGTTASIAALIAKPPGTAPVRMSPQALHARWAFCSRTWSLASRSCTGSPSWSTRTRRGKRRSMVPLTSLRAGPGSVGEQSAGLPWALLHRPL